MNKRQDHPPMRVIPRFVHNPDKVERGLKAMADILAFTMRKSQSIRTINRETSD